MLTRLYIDNFRCFVNFEHKAARRQLILGANGSGKSSFLDALVLLRQFVTKGDIFDDFFILGQRTRWLNQPQQTWEVEAELDGGRYVYRLVIEPWGEPTRPRVASETVHLDGKPIFEFAGGEVHLYNDRFEHTVGYPFDWHRSAFATIRQRKDNQKLSRFKLWFSGLYCFRINPFGMGSRADGESLYPNVDLSNIASWYRHLLQSDQKQNASMLNSLNASLDGFSVLQTEPAGENVRLLYAEFTQAGGRTSKFYFHELSDGQRCLICLYMILHFLLAKGSTVIIDEPDNFISLREIQPWLTAVSDTVEDGQGQILLISHHPEAINQWAPSNGVQFVREDAGPVRVQEFRGDPDACVSPSELIARGWERE
jgi:ABC-type molybdenum transport system ATPase subunit/photorepair protein PhrA